MAKSNETRHEIEITNRFYVDEYCVDRVWDDKLEPIENPTDISGLWQVAVKAKVFIGRGESHRRYENPLALSSIGIATTALREAMASLEPPVILEEWDERVQIEYDYEDDWSPGLSPRAEVDKFHEVYATFEQTFDANQDVPRATPTSRIPDLEIGTDFF